jgi:3-hydroxyisobutyrate dehydrogenase
MMKKFGFPGLGTMGLPMALNIIGAGFDVMVYNRTGGKAGPVLDAGAVEAEQCRHVYGANRGNG